MLGPLEAHDRGRPVDLGTPRVRTLLATLLLQANRVVSIDELVERMWGEQPPGNPRRTVQTNVARLRLALAAGGRAVQTHERGYLIEVDQWQLDLLRFRALVEQAHPGEDPARRLRLLDQALSLWRGEALAGMTAEVLARDEVPRLAEERLTAQETLIDVRLTLGQHAELISELTALTSRYPLRERLWGYLMIALFRSSRQAEALHTYRVLSRKLALELGLDPSDELQRLHRAVLTGDPSLAVSTPGSASPVRPSWTVECQLPMDLADFVGRRSGLNRIDDLLSIGGTPVVTVSGPPGVGKTALVVRAAHRLRWRFPDGQWYVRLGGATGSRDAADVLADLLRTSGMEGPDIPERLDARAAAFRGRLADRKVLLVFDDAAGADQIEPLLPGTSGCAVLATARSSLSALAARYPAHEITLDPLPPTDARTLLTRVLRAGRRHIEPAAVAELADLCGQLPLALRISAAALVARPSVPAARWIDGLRTGNRLARLTIDGSGGSALRSAFDQAYAALGPELRRLFGLLGLVPGPDVTARAAAALLGPDAAPAGGPYLVARDRAGRNGAADHYRAWHGGAAADIGGSAAGAPASDAADRGVGDLNRASRGRDGSDLGDVPADGFGPAPGVPGSSSPVHGSAPADPDAAFAGFNPAPASAPASATGPDRADHAWAAHVRAGHARSDDARSDDLRADDVRAADDTVSDDRADDELVVDDGQDLDRAERLLDGLAAANLIQRHGDRFAFHDLLRLYAAERGADEPDAASAWARLCDWYLATAEAAVRLDGPNPVPLPSPVPTGGDRFRTATQARTWLDAERPNLVAAAVRAAGPFSWQLADSLMAYFQRGQHTRDWEAATVAGLRAAEAVGYRLGEAAMHRGLASARHRSGGPLVAIEHLTAALDRYRREDAAAATAVTLCNLGYNHFLSGDMRTALATLDRGITLIHQLDRSDLLGTALNLCCIVQTHSGELGTALHSATAGLEIEGAPRTMLYANRGEVRRVLGDYPGALADASQALALARRSGIRRSEAVAHDTLTRIRLDNGDLDLARQHAECVLNLADLLDDTWLEAGALIAIGDVYRLRGVPARAGERYARAVRLAIGSGSRIHEAEARLSFAVSDLTNGRTASARERAHVALDIADRSGLRLVQCQASHLLAAISDCEGDAGAAAAHAARAAEVQAETGYHPPPHFPVLTATRRESASPGR